MAPSLIPSAAKINKESFSLAKTFLNLPDQSLNLISRPLFLSRGLKIQII